MLALYVARHLTDAQLLADHLREQGIQTYIRNEALQGVLGELPLSVQPEVCILDRADWAAASAIVGAYERCAREPIVGPDRWCAACGEQSPSNFELCWQCRAPFPVH